MNTFYNICRLLVPSRNTTSISQGRDVNVSINSVSATVVYYDVESAEMAKKYLDQKEFNTRKIKIMVERSR